MKRLSYGERDAGDGGRQYLRDLFLHHVSEVPGVIESLTSEALKFPLQLGHLYFDECMTARQFLNEWTKEWHLDANWVRERVFEKMCFWAVDREEYRIYDLGVGSGSAVSMLSPAGLPTYHSGHMTRPQYFELVRSDAIFKLQHDPLLNRGDIQPFVESIVRSAEAYCDAADQQSAPAAIKLELERDLLWTVRFQIELRDYSEIAAQDLPGRMQANDLVRKAVRDILKRIELPSRVRRGRKKGSKNEYDLTELGRNKNVREI